jgi:hypothetical protein
MLLHDQVVEVPSRVDSSLFVEATLMHEAVDFIDKIFPHLQELGAAHLVVAIADIGRRVGETGCFEEAKNDGGVSSVLHRHQTLVVDRDGEFAGLLESFSRVSVLFGDCQALIVDIATIVLLNARVSTV